MSESQAEAFAGAVEVRSVDEPKRLATLLVCRYGERSTLVTPPELFVNGAFTASVGKRGDRVPFTDRHTGGTGEIRGGIVARPVSWDTSGAGELVAVLKFFDTPEAWKVYTRARDGEIDGASVGFKALAERAAADGTREVTEAELHHVMLCATADGEIPVYSAPRLLEVRAAVDVDALLAVKWDPKLAEDRYGAEDLARLAEH